MTTTTVLNIEGHKIEISVEFDPIMDEFGPSNTAYRTCCQLKEKLAELQISFDDEQLQTLCDEQFKAQHVELYADHKKLWEAYWEMRKMWDNEPGLPGWPYPSKEFSISKAMTLKGIALEIVIKYDDWQTWHIQKFYWDEFNTFEH